MPRYHGRKGAIYMSTTGTGAATMMVSMNAWSLDRSTDLVDVTAFGDINKVFVAGLPNLQGSLSGWWDTASDLLYDGATSADGVKLYLYPSTDAMSKYFYGPAWVNFNIEVGVNDAVSISGDFAANGAWGKM